MNAPTRICPICKTAITPGERFCGNCGTPFPEPTAVDPTQMSGSDRRLQQGQIQYNEAPPPPYGATSYGANMPPPPNSGYNPTVPAYGAGPTPAYGPSTPFYEPSPPAPNYGPSAPFYNASGYTPSSPTYGPSAPNYEPTPSYNPPATFTPNPAAYPYQPAPQTPPKRSRAGLIVGIIVAVTIVVIAACGGTILLASKSASTTANTNSTATAGAHPTATAIPKPQVLFSDNFANNDKNWDVGSQSGLNITIDNNQMTLKEANKKRLDEEIPTNQAYADFSLSAKVTLISGDSNDRAGFRFRASGDDLGYFVRIFGDDTYDIHKVYQDSNKQSQDTELVNVTSSAALNTEGTANLVQIIAKGSTIILYFNGSRVQVVSDTTFSSGPIFLNAGNGDTSKGVVASFSNVELDAAPAALS